MNRRNSFFTGFFYLFISFHLSAQTISLPRSSPEIEGVSSKGILNFLDAVETSKHELHSIMILRHGKVIAEGWWNPYRADLKHTLYSLSKSFTSTAVGFAVAEKKLSVNDKVISFFPDKLPVKVSDNLSILTVKDLLSMSAGQAPDPTGLVAISDDWIKTFFATPIINKPGSVFLYNSAATYMLSAIVQKVTGQKIIDYLTPRLFQPLGIAGMDWEIDPAERNVGGWGLRVKTEDIAKFAQLYLQKGKWRGIQILPEAWVNEATTFKIDNAQDMSQERKDSSDWRQGYCYQFWRSRHNSYRGDGAFGQYALVLPDEDAVIAITSESSDMQGELNLVWQYLLPAMRADRSTFNMNDAVELKKRMATLKLKLPVSADTSFRQYVNASHYIVNDKKFKIESNSKKVETISFVEKNNVIELTIRAGDKTYSIDFGDGTWIEGKTTMPGPSLVQLSKNHFVGLPESQVAGVYSWATTNALEMHLRYIDSPHTLRMNFYFDRDKVTVDMLDSFKSVDKKITLKGEAGK
ncbi:MAG TPA: serine hydrolase [Chitinophagaceae bacterium]